MVDDEVTSDLRSTTNRRHVPAGPPMNQQPAGGHAIGVGYLVLTMRELAGMSQLALANAAGTSQGAIARVESGAHVPSLTSLLSIADAMGWQLVLGLATPDTTELDDLALVGVVIEDPLDGLPCYRVLREPPPWASYSM